MSRQGDRQLKQSRGRDGWFLFAKSRTKQVLAKWDRPGGKEAERLRRAICPRNPLLREPFMNNDYTVGRANRLSNMLGINASRPSSCLVEMMIHHYGSAAPYQMKVQGPSARTLSPNHFGSSFLSPSQPNLPTHSRALPASPAPAPHFFPPSPPRPSLPGPVVTHHRPAPLLSPLLCRRHPHYRYQHYHFHFH